MKTDQDSKSVAPRLTIWQIRYHQGSGEHQHENSKQSNTIIQTILKFSQSSRCSVLHAPQYIVPVPLLVKLVLSASSQGWLFFQYPSPIHNKNFPKGNDCDWNDLDGRRVFFRLHASLFKHLVQAAQIILFSRLLLDLLHVIK